jgi:MFS family permease
LSLGTLALLPADVRQTLLKLFGSGLLFWSSLSCLFPILPLYLEDLGSTPFEIGFVMAGFGMGVLVFRPSLGRLSDLRSRKLALLIGMVAITIAPLGYWLVKSIWLLLLIRIFHGISLAAFASAYLMLVADLTPAAHRAEIIGYMSLEQPLGLSLGPAIGGLLLEVTGYRTVFLLAAAFGISAYLLASYIPDGQGEPQPELAKNDRRFWRMLASRRVLVPAITMLLVGMSIGNLHTFAAPYIRAMKVGLNPGLFFAAIAVTTFGIRFVAGMIGDRWGRGAFMTYGLAGSSLAMLLMGIAHSAPLLLLAALLQGAGFGILVPTVAALAADRAGSRERGRVFSLCMMGFDIGMTLGGLLLGSLAEITGYRHLFGIAAGLIVLGLAIFMTCGARNLQESWQFALGRRCDPHD